jgi:hypothetical protein
MANALDRLATNIATYVTLSEDRSIDQQDLNQLKMEIAEQLYSIPTPQAEDDEEVRVIYNAALEILTGDNSVIVAAPVSLTNKTVQVLSNVSNTVLDSIKKIAQNRRGLLYLGGAAAMYYFQGLSGLPLVVTLYAMDRLNATYTQQYRIEQYDPARRAAPPPIETGETRLID